MKFKKDNLILDKMNSLFFKNKLNSCIKGQTEVDIDKHLYKFEEFKKKEDIKIRDSIEKFKMAEIKSRDILINKVRCQNKKFNSFNLAWEQKGLDNWKDNLLNKKEREKNDLEFELNLANKFQNRLLKSIKLCENDMEKKINNFEKVLKNNFLIESIQKRNEDHYDDNKIDNVINNPNLNFSSPKLSKLNQIISPERNGNPKLSIFNRKKILTQKLISDIKNKMIFDTENISERDRRRRKMIVDFTKAYVEIDNMRKEDVFIEKTKKLSNQEKAFLYEIHKMEQNKKIILENKKLLDEMYDERKDMELKFVDKNEEEFLNMHRETFERTMEKEFLKKRDMDISIKQKERLENNTNCSIIINLLLDITDVLIK